MEESLRGSIHLNLFWYKVCSGGWVPISRVWFPNYFFSLYTGNQILNFSSPTSYCSPLYSLYSCHTNLSVPYYKLPVSGPWLWLVPWPAVPRSSHRLLFVIQVSIQIAPPHRRLADHSICTYPPHPPSSHTSRGTPPGKPSLSQSLSYKLILFVYLFLCIFSILLF